MNAPARIPQGSARITYRGRDQFVARMPCHRSAVWAPRTRTERFVRWLTRGQLRPFQAVLGLIATPLIFAPLIFAWFVTP